MTVRAIKGTTFCFILLFAICNLSHAQSAGPSGDTLATAIPPIQAQDAGGAFWRIDGNFESVFHLRNVLETRPLTVTPVLWMADGTEYKLAPVTIEKSGVVSIDINEALRNAPPDVAPHVSDVGSAGVRYDWRWAAITGQVISSNEVDSLTYTTSISAFFESTLRQQKKSSQQNRLEGMWWQRDSGVEPFITLVNTSSKPISATVALTGENDGAPIQSFLQISPKQSQLVKLGDLIHRLPMAATAGGISIIYQGKLHSLVVEGGLQNFAEGYSAPMVIVAPETRRVRKQISTANAMFAAIGVQVGAPEARMQFPQNTVFQPYATLRNLASQPAHIRVAATFMNPNAITMQLGAIVLSARETRQVDLEGMLKQAGLTGYSGEMNFAFQSDRGGDELLAAMGSTSIDGNYVFNVAPMLLIPETGKIFCFWAASGKTDTMISFWNSGSDAEDAELLLDYQGGEYKLPIHLEANASYSMNIRSLIASGKPDANGKIIPSNAVQGSARLINPRDMRATMDIHAHLSVFNVETATCMEPCPECDSIIYVIAAPNGVTAAGGTVQYHTTATSKTDGSYDVTWKTNWSSSNTGIATIVGSGTNGGLATGKAMGSATFTGSYRDTGVPHWSDGDLCPYGTQCPVFIGNPTAPVSVCDYTISPGGMTAQYCNGTSKNTQNFTANITPSSDACPRHTASTQCGADVVDGPIDLVGASGVSSCTDNSLAVASTVTYYAGPGASKQKIGDINVNFSLQFGASTVAHSDKIPVVCP